MGHLEIVNLIKWLKDHGHSDAEILDCIQYMETGRAKEEAATAGTNDGE